MDCELVCLLRSGGNTPPLLVQILCARYHCPKAPEQGHIHFSCICRHLHPNSGTTLSADSVMKKIVLIEQERCSQKVQSYEQIGTTGEAL